MHGLPSVVDEAVRNLRGAGLGAVSELSCRSHLRYVRSLSPDPVFDADWDLLVVLDACRADLWDEVADEFGHPTGEHRISPGGTSTEWLDATFGECDAAELAELGHVTANPYSESHVDGEQLGYLDEVWRDGWDDDVGTVRPRAVTDAAVAAGRAADVDRLVVHYMQPHFPSLADASDVASGMDAPDVASGMNDGVALADFGEDSLSVWEDLRFGNRDRAEVWTAYRENLRIVLGDVDVLLDNLDAERAVLTADHGNAMGEFSIYGHAAGLAHRPLRTVPWAETTAADEGTHEPPEPVRDRAAAIARGDGGTRANAAARDDDPAGEDPDVEERLRSLGYR